jgi:hypothetical protein
MPNWRIHNKWAEKLAVGQEASELVNLLIDFPTKCQEYVTFCETGNDARVFSKGKPTTMTSLLLERHDSARSRTVLRDVQLRFLRQKGAMYVRAWYLHQMLDYLEWWCRNTLRQGCPAIKDILTPRRLVKKIGPLEDADLQCVRNFVVGHSEEVMFDCGS